MIRSSPCGIRLHRPNARLVSLGGALLLAACASTPPPVVALSEAKQAIAAADQAQLIGANSRSSSSTSEASSPVLESAGSCFRDAFSAKTFRGASDGMLQRKRGLALYIAISSVIRAAPQYRGLSLNDERAIQRFWYGWKM
jgi:hypothetical protein